MDIEPYVEKTVRGSARGAAFGRRHNRCYPYEVMRLDQHLWKVGNMI